MRTRFPVLAAILAAGVLGYGSLVPRPAEAAGPGTWTAAADMPVARYAHTLTLLRDGRVLMAGGSPTQGAYSRDAAIYSRATNAWTLVPQMHFYRSYHRATLLRDGRVLITGGFVDGASSDPRQAEIYDPAANTWTLTAPMYEERMEHTATLLADGRVLVAAGNTPPFQSPLTSTAIYDPDANTWMLVAPMLGPLVLASAALLPGGKVLVAGGPNFDETPQVYNVATDTWTPTIAPPGLNLDLSRSVRLPDGRVLTVNGREAAMYDSTPNTWTSVSPPNNGELGTELGTLNLLGNGRVLRAGGGPSTVAQEFDPATLAWTTVSPMATARLYHEAVLLHSGELFVTGGDTSTGAVASAELYDATSWQTVASVTPGRQGAAASILHSGKVVVAGSGSGEAYDPALDQWTATGAMIENRRFHTATLLASGKVLVAGGYTPGFMPIATSELYDPLTNAWSSSAAMATGGGFSRAVRLSNNKVLFIGDSGPTASMAELYDPGTNTWSAAGTLASQFEGTLTLLANGKVLLAGGYYFLTPTQQVDQTTAQLYDPATNVWSPTGSMGIARSGQGATRMPNGRVLVMGGDSASGSAEIYDPGTGAWTAAGSMAVARHHFASALLEDGTIIVAGGLTGVAYVGGAEIYHPSADTWTAAGTLAVPRAYQPSVLMTDGSWLLPGGSGTSTHGLPSVERYDLGIHTDTDGDGYNDGLELALGQHPWSHCKTMRADLTGDGFVNSGDQGKMASKFGVRPPPSRVDQNGDKILNSGDQGLMASVFNKSLLMCA